MCIMSDGGVVVRRIRNDAATVAVVMGNRCCCGAAVVSVLEPWLVLVVMDVPGADGMVVVHDGGI